MKINLIAVAAAIAYFGSVGPAASLIFELDFNEQTIESSNEPPNGPGATGASGVAKFEFSDLANSNVQLKLTVTNTTGLNGTFGTEATDSKLLAFYFDSINNLDYVSNSFNSSDPLDEIEEDATFQPFSNRAEVGNFEIGVCHALNNQSDCTGSQPNNGLGVGASSMSTLEFTSTDTASIIGALLEAAFANGDANAGLRFQAVNGTGAGSDKLLYIPPPVSSVPLPATLPLLLGAFAVFGFTLRRSRRV